MFSQLLPASKASTALMQRLRLILNYQNDVFPPQFRRDKLIFLPIPGSGGDLFLDAYLGFQIRPLTVEQCFRCDRLFFSSAFVYAFVRHPIDRFLVSLRRVEAGQLMGVDQMALRCELARLGTGAEAIATNLSAEGPLLEHALFRPQHSFLQFKEKLYVDRVFKAETWKQDLALLQQITGIQLREPDPSLVDTAFSIDERSTVLGESAIANLRRLYARDFELFGYC